LSAPTAHPSTIASSVAQISWIPNVTLSVQASTAPIVTSSPCEKFVSPVIPKISDRPTAVIPMTSPKRIPSTSSRSTWAAVEVPRPSRSAPKRKITADRRSSAISRVTSPCCTSVPCGSDSESTRKV
jgi:hypothetical protein